MIFVSASDPTPDPIYSYVPVMALLLISLLLLLLTTIASPAISEPQVTGLEIPDQILVGERLNVSVSLSPVDEVQSVRFRMWNENRTQDFPIDLWGENGTWVISIPNLEAGTIPWDLEVNNIVVDSGEVGVMVLEDDSSQWPLVLVAVLFVLAFIGVEMSFKPGRRRKQLPDDDVEEIMEEPPEEEYESSSIIRDETGKLQ